MTNSEAGGIDRISRERRKMERNPGAQETPGDTERKQDCKMEER